MKKPTIAGGLFIHGMLQMVEMGGIEPPSNAMIMALLRV